ncbi:MAG: DUF692 domain-containing protein [Pelagibacterales bacterium]|nr:DUF692 domain-containing protein [Pelagibacterales bacterium]
MTTKITQKSPIHNDIVGIGLRSPHINSFLKKTQKIGWLEVHSENYYAEGGPSIKNLKKIRENYPISLHCVGNSLGSFQKIDLNHLKKLKNLIETIDPVFVSDHISWGMIDNNHFNDLLPLPYNYKSLAAIADNVDAMQNFLKREILVENPSSYISFKNEEMDEADFINQLTKKTGCFLLLDVNNIFVSSSNNKNFKPHSYLKKLNKEIVKEIHLAGHSKSKIFDGKKNKTLLIDTHNNEVCKEVWNIYMTAIKNFGQIPTLIEWDQDIPELKVLLSEATKARKILQKNAKKNS